MARLRFVPAQGQMVGSVIDLPVFPGESFGLGLPEAIGDVARAIWFGALTPHWDTLPDGVARCRGEKPGELSYTLTVTPHEDFVDVHLALVNLSKRIWQRGFAFNCFNCGAAPSISDHECLRHWVRWRGEFKRLIQVPRKFSPRPTVQLYSVEGAPLGKDLPFVASFEATPEKVTLEGWIAIRSRDASRLVAAISRPTLFLFQNMEYSCIHASPDFGPLEPGQTGHALTRFYFVKSSLEDWHARAMAEMAAVEVPGQSD